MRHASHPPQTALRPHPTRLIYLSLDGRAYSGLGWRFLFASTQAGRLHSGHIRHTRVCLMWTEIGPLEVFVMGGRRPHGHFMDRPVSSQIGL